ncbi:hypothetical protein FQA39_LY18234 [Lamprigera yunnana]|nr:hypothetical protein FQA39_LY18234 [Lamprigera yunnana]
MPLWKCEVSVSPLHLRRSSIAQFLFSTHEFVNIRCTKMWFLIVLLTIFLLYLLLTKLSYWNTKHVKQVNPFKILLYMFVSFIPRKSIAEYVQDSYMHFPGQRYCGIYQFFHPLLVIRDPDLIKQLTVKDFEFFVDHNLFVPENSEPMWEKNLFALKGDKWKTMRNTLSPSFTSSKMKMMFNLISEYAKNFVKYFEDQPGTIPIEMKDTFTRFTNDVIATAAFGINCDSIRNPKNEFYLMGKNIVSLRGFFRGIGLLILFILPQTAKKLGIKFLPQKPTKFFTEIVKENIKNREQNHIVRPDMIHLLLEARKNANKIDKTLLKNDIDEEVETRQKDELTDEDITAQALIFFFAGFDSVSTLMCFMAHELAVNVDVQERLQSEVDDTFHQYDGNITYDAISKMKYMDMVISETLRKWPPTIASDRVCVKPYTIPPVNNNEKPLHLKKGDFIWVPTFGIQRDPELFPNPERFDPERFNDENKQNLNQYTYLPFGVGPRACIGNRFALMETKLVFYHILSKFNFVVINKTTVPLKIEKTKGDITLVALERYSECTMRMRPGMLRIHIYKKGHVLSAEVSLAQQVLEMSQNSENPGFFSCIVTNFEQTLTATVPFAILALVQCVTIRIYGLA